MQFRKSDFWSLASKATGVAFLLICANGIQAQQTFGYVLDVSGEWLFNGKVKLSKGSSLNVGGVITGNPSDSTSSIVVANRSGHIFEKRNCRNVGECNRPIRLPRSAGGDRSILTQVFGALVGIWSGEPAKYASFVSRGADLQEALIKLSDQKLDLSQVFKNLPSDRYLVRFEKLGDKKEADGPLKPVPFDWDSKKPTPLVARDLGPGLYRVSIQDVSLLEPEEGNESSGNEAWVLVTAPDDYVKAARTFDAMVNATRQWGTKVKQGTVRPLLRATLEFIKTQSTH